jgi:hypothetical protein
LPIILPIHDASGLVFTVDGVLAGDTNLVGALAVRFGVSGNLVGGTAMSADMGGTYTIDGHLVGDTALDGFLRINGEANVFLSGDLFGATALAGFLASAIGAGATFAGQTLMTGELSVEEADEASFVLAADILDTSLTTQGSIRRYAARLLVNGVEVKIRRATLEAREDTLGTELSVALLVPDASLVPLAASIDFAIGLWNGTSFTWVTLIAGGRLSSRGNTLKNDASRPVDEVQLSVVDVVADRWNRAPRRPIHMYDPQLSPAPSESSLTSNRIELLGGGYITQLAIAVPGLRLSNVLAEAYVTGCGFSGIVTNIPNFSVPEADFSLDGGWDGGVRPLLAPFAPVVFERDNKLYIVDPDAPLPAGLSPRDFTHAQTKEISDNVPQREPVNSLLLKIKSAAGGEYFTERLDTETTSAGTFGTDGYTETDTSRRIKEYRDFADPLVIVREELETETTRVLDFQFNLIESTVETKSFDAFNRLTGSVKRTSMRIPDPENDGTMTFMADVTRQDQSITYITDPRNPELDLQDRVTTVLSGLVLVDDDNQYLGKAYRIPVLDAHRSGYIDPTGNQHLEQMDIRTTVEQLRVRGEQVDVQTRVIDHVSDIPTRNVTTTRPATASSSRKVQIGSRTILLTTPGTDTTSRRAQVLDAGELPYAIALALGKRKLARLNSPPREVSALPGYVDLTVRRGSVLSLKKRGGSALGTYIVRGWTIEFDEGGQTATMSLRARELLT